LPSSNYKPPLAQQRPQSAPLINNPTSGQLPPLRFNIPSQKTRVNAAIEEEEEGWWEPETALYQGEEEWTQEEYDEYYAQEQQQTNCQHPLEEEAEIANSENYIVHDNVQYFRSALDH
jgi:hypothetical protein